VFLLEVGGRLLPLVFGDSLFGAAAGHRVPTPWEAVELDESPPLLVGARNT
jgi:hypothetical protein